MFVADALDAVAAEAVHEEGRALQRLGGDDLEGGILFLEEIAGRDSAGGAGGGNKGSGAEPGIAERRQDILESRPGDVVVEDGIPEFLELVKDDVVRVGF